MGNYILHYLPIFITFGEYFFKYLDFHYFPGVKLYVSCYISGNIYGKIMELGQIVYGYMLHYL